MKEWTIERFNSAPLVTVLRAALANGLAEKEPLKAIYARIVIACRDGSGVRLSADEVYLLAMDWAVSEAAENGARDLLLSNATQAGGDP